MEKQLRRRWQAGLLLLFPLVLSGCLKFTMDLEVSRQDTVSGTVIFAVSQELQAFAEQDGGEDEPWDPFADFEGGRVTDFDDGSFVGQQYEFSRVPMEDFSLSDDVNDLRIQRDGDNLVVSGNFSLEEEESGPSEEGVIDLGEGFFDTADLRVSIKFPGEIRETNGEVNEETNTITWIPKYGEANELSAVVYAPRGVPVWVWWAAGSGLVAFVLVFLAIRWVRSKRARPTQGVEEWFDSRVDREPRENDLKAPTVESNHVESPSVAAIETGSPVFAYRVRKSLFPPEWLEVKVQADEILFAFVRGRSGSSTSWERISVAAITSVTELSDGFGARVVHAGQVDVIPAKKSDARTLVGLIESLTRGSAGSPDATQVARQSVADYLKELAQLKDEGVISEAEFDELKKKKIQAE